jgi:choline dehydrogenase-like flavoprotein
MAGCAIGAKWSTLYTEIPKAEATGHYEIRPESMVLKINHNKEGKATGVVYADKDGNTHEQKARVVAIAGNSVETPRLLLNSESSMFPDGMANSSGQVGQNFMRHMTGTVYGTMPGAVHWDRGTQMAGIVMDEVKNDPNRGFVGGYYMQTLPGFGLGWYAGNVGGMSADAPGKWGRNYTRDVVENYKNMAGMWLVGEDMPQEKNGVTLHGSEKDSYGLPVPVVNFEDHANDVAMRNHAYKAGSAVYQAGGSKKQYQLSPFPSTHNMGTCRMSEKPGDGVCNSIGATHDVSNVFISDGSQFTTGAACNPTLTIVSLAIRQAENMTKLLSQNSI